MLGAINCRCFVFFLATVFSAVKMRLAITCFLRAQQQRGWFNAGGMPEERGMIVYDRPHGGYFQVAVRGFFVTSMTRLPQFVWDILR